MNLITEEKAKWVCFIGMTFIAVILAIFVFIPKDNHNVIQGQQVFEVTYNNTIIQPTIESYHTSEITSTAGAPGRKILFHEFFGNNMCVVEIDNGKEQCYCNRVAVERYLCK